MTALLLDTSVAVMLRDRDERIVKRAAGLDSYPVLSMVGRVELENGVYREPSLVAVRRHALDLLVSTMTTISFGDDELAAYRAIVAACGYSRPKVLDRMIAATAIANGLTLATANAADVRDVPGLAIDDWAA